MASHFSVELDTTPPDVDFAGGGRAGDILAVDLRLSESAAIDARFMDAGGGVATASAALPGGSGSLHFSLGPGFIGTGKVALEATDEVGNSRARVFGVFSRVGQGLLRLVVEAPTAQVEAIPPATRVDVESPVAALIANALARLRERL